MDDVNYGRGNDMKKIKILLIGLLLTVIVGCSDVHHHDKSEVAAVYWHEYNEFSVAIVKGNELKLTRLPRFVHVTVLIDVGPDENAWYECNWITDYFNGIHTSKSDSLCELHIKSSSSILTANWNHGRFSSGTTTRIN